MSQVLESAVSLWVVGLLFACMLQCLAQGTSSHSWLLRDNKRCACQGDGMCLGCRRACCCSCAACVASVLCCRAPGTSTNLLSPVRVLDSCAGFVAGLIGVVWCVVRCARGTGSKHSDHADGSARRLKALCLVVLQYAKVLKLFVCVTSVAVVPVPARGFVCWLCGLLLV